MSTPWQIVVFLVDGKANHVALALPDDTMADLSLLGARVVPWSGGQLPKGERLSWSVEVPDPDAALAFLRQPGLLCAPIRAQERAARGWHLTFDAPDFVRTLRDSRSRDPDDMNCVEWIVHALELGGVEIGDDVMTPTEMRAWCEARAPAA